MRAHVLTVIMLGAAVLAGGEGNAQQPAAPPASPRRRSRQDALLHPYGPPISAQRAQAGGDG